MGDSKRRLAVRLTGCERGLRGPAAGVMREDVHAAALPSEAHRAETAHSCRPVYAVAREDDAGSKCIGWMSFARFDGTAFVPGTARIAREHNDKTAFRVGFCVTD